MVEAALVGSVRRALRAAGSAVAPAAQRNNDVGHVLTGRAKTAHKLHVSCPNMSRCQRHRAAWPASL
jgi:hypothetical protein